MLQDSTMYLLVRGGYCECIRLAYSAVRKESNYAHTNTARANSEAGRVLRTGVSETIEGLHGLAGGPAFDF